MLRRHIKRLATSVVSIGYAALSALIASLNATPEHPGAGEIIFWLFAALLALTFFFAYMLVKMVRLARKISEFQKSAPSTFFSGLRVR